VAITVKFLPVVQVTVEREQADTPSGAIVVEVATVIVVIDVVDAVG
jgi:hypothetical protein